MREGVSFRASLRPLRASDLDLLYSWITSRNLVILNSAYSPISEEEHKDWFGSISKSKSTVRFFMIDELNSGKTIGSCQLFNINWVHRSAELQIRIGRSEFMGVGLGAQAVAELSLFGFKDLNLHRIYLHVFSDNARALKTYEKSGFVIEGTLRQSAYIDGQWKDILIMSLLNTNNV